MQIEQHSHGDNAAAPQATVVLARMAAMIAIFVFSVLTVLIVALAAPAALAVSAVLRALAPVRRRGRWRIAQPA